MDDSRRSEVGLFDCAVSTNTGTPGQILSVSDAGIEVAAGEGSIQLQRVRPAGSGKVPAAEFASSVSISVGDQMGG